MNRAGLDLLKEFEGFRGKAYRDPVGIWTIGYGFIEGVREGQTMTRAQAEARLKRELVKYETAVTEAAPDANENQVAAMTCLAFNIGVTGFLKSTVLKAHRRGDEQAAARAFGLWNKAGGRVFAGLTRRRAAEAALYLKPVEGEALEMPQAVEPESMLRASPLMSTGTATAAVSATSVAAQVAGDIGTVKESLGDILPVVILAAAIIGIGFGAFTVWQRYRQRKDGWA
jgi:lysozyme